MTNPINKDQIGRLYGMIGIPDSFDSDKASESWNHYKTQLGCDALCLVRQTHGNSVFELTERPTSEGVHVFGDADAIITVALKPKVAIAVRVADCLGVILSTKKMVAAVHAGWRGLENKILENVISQMRSMDSSSKISAWLSAGASECCYQVGAEVIQNAPPQSFKYETDSKTKARLSLEKWARFQLSGLGIKEIQSDSRCTICTPELHSYRRNGNSLRNLVFITTC